MLVSVEAAVNIAYGYDIRGEVLGETGTIELAESGPIVVKREGGFGGRVPERLARAVHPRLRHRVPGVDRRGRGRALHRPELVGRLRRHRRVRRRASRPTERATKAPVRMRERPDLYRDGRRRRTGTD